MKRIKVPLVAWLFLQMGMIIILAAVFLVYQRNVELATGTGATMEEGQ